MTASSKRNVAKKPALVQALADVVRMPCSRRWNSQTRDVDCRVWRFRRGGLRKLCCNFQSLLRVSRCRHRRSLVEESIHVHLDGDHSIKSLDFHKGEGTAVVSWRGYAGGTGHTDRRRARIATTSCANTSLVAKHWALRGHPANRSRVLASLCKTWSTWKGSTLLAASSTQQAARSTRNSAQLCSKVSPDGFPSSQCAISWTRHARHLRLRSKNKRLANVITNWCVLEAQRLEPSKKACPTCFFALRVL